MLPSPPALRSAVVLTCGPFGPGASLGFSAFLWRPGGQAHSVGMGGFGFLLLRFGQPEVALQVEHRLETVSESEPPRRASLSVAVGVNGLTLAFGMCYCELFFPVSASRAACRSLLAHVPYTHRGDEDPGAARGSSPGLVWAHPLPHLPPSCCLF